MFNTRCKRVLSTPLQTHIVYMKYEEGHLPGIMTEHWPTPLGGSRRPSRNQTVVQVNMKIQIVGEQVTFNTIKSTPNQL
jgi:hypothetical protein